MRRVSEARTYLDLAVALLQPARIRLIAIGGLSGSGKSTIAAKQAAECGGAAGARVLRSDVIRKHLFAVDTETKLPEDAYSADVSEKVYREIITRADQAMRAGLSVIIDAVAARAEERESFAAIARDLGVPFAGVWLDVSEAVLIRRVSTRGKDASDATAAVVRQQLAYDLGPISWRKVDANGAEQEVLDAVRRAVDALPVAAVDAS